MAGAILIIKPLVAFEADYVIFRYLVPMVGVSMHKVPKQSETPALTRSLVQRAANGNGLAECGGDFDVCITFPNPNLKVIQAL